jgi:hypothetical protein
MSVGKYSPWTPHSKEEGYESFIYNCYGKIPEPCLNFASYDEKQHFVDYDSEGFDSYGYSAFDKEGNYSPYAGVDRHGNTESDYLNDHINGGDLYENP